MLGVHRYQLVDVRRVHVDHLVDVRGLHIDQFVAVRGCTSTIWSMFGCVHMYLFKTLEQYCFVVV